MKKVLMKFIILVFFIFLSVSCQETKKIEITNKDIQMYEGEELYIEVNIAIDELVFESLNQNIAILEQNKIKALKAGELEILISLKENTKINTKVNVTVKPINILTYDCSLYVGQTIDVNDLVSIEEEFLHKINYEVNDLNIGSLENGKLIAKNVGKTTINVTIENNSLSSIINLEVKEMKLNIPNKLELKINENLNIINYINTFEEKDKLEFSIENEEIAVISNNEIQGLKVGNTFLVVKYEDLVFKYEIIVTKEIEVEEIVVNNDNIELEIGETFDLVINIKPDNAVNKNVTIKVIEGLDHIAIESYKIKGISIGQAIILIESENGIKKEIKISVTEEEMINEILNEALDNLLVPEVKDEKIELIKQENIKNYLVDFSYEFSDSIVDEKGFVRRKNETVELVITVKASIGQYSVQKELTTITLSSKEEYVNELMKEIIIPTEVNDNIILPTNINWATEIQWTSSKPRILSNSGVCEYVPEDVPIKLSALVIHTDDFFEYEYNITVKPFNEERKINEAIENITVPKVVSKNFYLPTVLDYNVTCEWTSNNENIINYLGHVVLTNKEEEVVLTLHVKKQDNTVITKDFVIETTALKLNENEIYFGNHTLVDKANNMLESNMDNLTLVDGKVVLEEGKLTGSYTSPIYVTNKFEEIVGSWSVTTSLKATCELKIRVRINGVWSKYFSYGEWGLGRTNLYYNQSDTYSRMSVDEILINDGYYADAFQYIISLKRESVTDNTLKLSLIAATLTIPNYYYKVDTSKLSDSVDYDVPKVNQNVVPSIGSVICSATTTTMLLKYKGFDFSSYDTYENRYIANLVADTGHNSPTYGNWTYNMAVAGAYGLDAYVAKMYSWEELRSYLDNNGPVGASIAGDFGLYSTNGHLIVVRGYRIENGKTYVITNDPNVNTRFGAQYFVYYEVTLEMFLKVWRGITYIVE